MECIIKHVRGIEMTKSKGMKFMRWLWIVLLCLLFAMVILSVYFLPKTMPRLMQAVPFLTALITLIAGVAFGGTALKRGQNGKDS